MDSHSASRNYPTCALLKTDSAQHLRSPHASLLASLTIDRTAHSLSLSLSPSYSVSHPLFPFNYNLKNSCVDIFV
jgi:hypothetical protein